MTKATFKPAGAVEPRWGDMLAKAVSDAIDERDPAKRRAIMVEFADTVERMLDEVNDNIPQTIDELV